MLEIPSRKRRFSLQDRSGRCLFPSATVHELKKVCEICLVGKSLRICLPVFWVRTCSQDIFKTIKGTNSSTETAEHSFSDISPRYPSDGKNRRNFNESRHIDFSSSTSGFCHKSETISSETISTKIFFRPKNRYPHHEFGTNREKDRKSNSEMPESTFSSSNQRFGVSKIDRSDKLNCPSSSACTSTAKVLTRAAIAILNQSCSYQSEIVLNSLSKQELV